MAIEREPKNHVDGKTIFSSLLIDRLDRIKLGEKREKKTCRKVEKISFAHTHLQLSIHIAPYVVGRFTLIYISKEHRWCSLFVFSTE